MWNLWRQRDDTGPKPSRTPRGNGVESENGAQPPNPLLLATPLATLAPDGNDAAQATRVADESDAVAAPDVVALQVDVLRGGVIDLPPRSDHPQFVFQKYGKGKAKVKKVPRTDPKIAAEAAWIAAREARGAANA